MYFISNLNSSIDYLGGQMKKLNILLFTFLLATSGYINGVAPMRSMTLGGATGLIVTPTARTGWETSDFGFNTGYHYVSDYNGTNLPKVGFYLFDKWEIGGTFDTQEEDASDVLFHTKFRFSPWSKNSGGGTALAIGGNYQSLEPWDNDAFQTYMAVTYGGAMFGMASETSFAVGKTFVTQGGQDSNLDFGMGFAVAFFPSIFKNYVNWVTDFGNFGYSANAYGAEPSRGVFNTGFRIAPINRNRIHLKLDVLMLDLLDDNRSFGAGLVFGMIF